MDKYSFRFLSIENKLNILRIEAELITYIPVEDNTITLYAYRGFLIEEYRNRDNNELLKIEAIMPDAENGRMKLYSKYIQYVDNSLEIEEIQERAKMACLNCDYEWFQDGRVKLIDVNCPVCETHKWTFLFKRICKNCTYTYYSNGGSHKRPCPKCN